MAAGTFGNRKPVALNTTVGSDLAEAKLNFDSDKLATVLLQVFLQQFLDVVGLFRWLFSGKYVLFLFRV